MKIIYLIAALALLFPTALFAGEDVRFELRGYGIYEKSKEKTEALKDKDTGRVYRASKKITITEQTDRIPAKMGVRFGVFCNIIGEIDTNQKLRRVRIHPEYIKPNGEKTTKDEWEAPARKDRKFTGVAMLFDKDYELVPGEYIFKLYYKEKVVLEKTFEVYKP